MVKFKHLHYFLLILLLNTPTNDRYSYNNELKNEGTDKICLESEDKISIPDPQTSTNSVKEPLLIKLKIVQQRELEKSSGSLMLIWKHAEK